MTTDKNKKDFEAWYVCDKKLKEESLDFFYELPFDMQYGVYLKYYHATKGWILNVKPYCDKFAIIIEKFWDETILHRELINNNYNSAQIELLKQANKMCI